MSTPPTPSIAELPISPEQAMAAEQQQQQASTGIGDIVGGTLDVASSAVDIVGGAIEAVGSIFDIFS